MSKHISSPLAAIEPRLRWLLPADLYAAAWIDPTPATLTQVFEHLRTLQRMLQDYLPWRIDQIAPDQRYTAWEEGTLMFTDLAGFTSLLEAYACYGRTGAEDLLRLLNSYFTTMINIISKSGGTLLEFSGDAMLVQFRPNRQQGDTEQAIRAGLRMQRAMAEFAHITTTQGVVSLGMRIGIHYGRFLTTDIGTPRRRERVLLGANVQRTKHAEGAGAVGRVCITNTARLQVQECFRFAPQDAEHVLVVDDLTDAQLGDYELAIGRRRQSNLLLFDRSVEGLVQTITEATDQTEPLASYLPRPILTLLVETASQRHIRPEFPELTVLFVNLPGLPGAADRAMPGEELPLLNVLSRVFTLVNAAVETRGGILKNVMVDHQGSSLLIYFGLPNAHTNDPLRAAAVALAIRNIVQHLDPVSVGDTSFTIDCQIGLNRGPAFAAEIGEPRGRREFNILGDTVNTAARLMSKAEHNQILLSESLHQAIRERFVCQELPALALKGKAQPVPLFALQQWVAGEEF